MLRKKKMKKCWHCEGSGRRLMRGRQLEPAELTPAQEAETLVLGGYYYESVLRPCLWCRGTGEKEKWLFRL